MTNHILKLILVILTMSGCQSTPSGDRTQLPLGSRDPDALMQAALSERDPDSAAELRLAASRLYAEVGDTDAALASLDGLSFGEGTLSDAIRRQRADLLKLLGRYEDARAELAQVAGLGIEDFLRTAEVCAAMADHRCAADGLIQAAEKANFDPAALPSDINDRIWSHLSQARKGPPVFTHRYHHAWWLLQQDMRSAQSAAQQVAAWRAWQRANPSHPARISPPAALARLDSYSIPKIGVLLPLSGRLASAGEAVRDGLISAYLAENGTAKPEIKIYDSAATDLGTLLETATGDGVQVFVGPLVKEDADRFAELAENAQIPTLVLNYLSTQPVSKSYVYELGIAIEDEATTLVEAVLNDGHEKVLIVGSNATWSRRAMGRFRELWRHTYTEADFSDIQGLTEAVGESMQVAASQERSDRIRRILGEPIEFLPRARNDLDAVVALTTQIESRALIPALEFHFASQLPVYATSQSARGNDLARLNGFKLTELPIFTAPNAEQAEMLNAYALAASPLAELYALGFDAYQVATWLPILGATKILSIDGATGFLSLESGGVFRRSLSVSRVDENGRLIPVRLDAS